MKTINRRYCRYVLVDAGDYRRVHLFYVRPQSTKKKRHIKKNPSSQVQAALNQKNAAHRVSDIIHANFTPADYFMTLSFKDSISAEEAQEIFIKFIRKLRDKNKKLGTKLKYIYAIEQGKKNGRIHIHVIINGAIDRSELEQMWLGFSDVCGYANTRTLQFTENGIQGLAHYMTKKPVVFDGNKQAKKWIPSKGLVRPEAVQNDYQIKIKEMKYIDEHPDDLAYIHGLFPDFYVADVNTLPKTADSPDFGTFVTLYLYRKDTKLFKSKKERGKHD